MVQNREWLIIFKIEALINGKTSLNSFVGLGFKRHTDGLEEIITTIVVAHNARIILVSKFVQGSQ